MTVVSGWRWQYGSCHTAVTTSVSTSLILWVKFFYRRIWLGLYDYRHIYTIIAREAHASRDVIKRQPTVAAVDEFNRNSKYCYHCLMNVRSCNRLTSARAPHDRDNLCVALSPLGGAQIAWLVLRTDECTVRSVCLVGWSVGCLSAAQRHTFLGGWKSVLTWSGPEKSTEFIGRSWSPLVAVSAFMIWLH